MKKDSVINKLQDPIDAPKRFFSFVFRVLVSFRRNQGLLLAGAIAYYTLLSIVPCRFSS